MRVAGLELGPGEAHGRGHPGYARNVLGAGATLLLLAPAQEHRLPGRAIADVEDADALRAIQLVSGEAEEIDAEGRGRDIHGAGRLHGIGVDDYVRVLRFRDPRDLRDRLERPDLVVGGHDGDDRGFGRHRGFERRQVHQSLGIDGQIGRAESFAFELLDRVKHSVVFDSGSDDVAAAAAFALGHRRATNRGVIGLGASAGEDDLFWRRAQKVRDHLACLVQFAPGLLAFQVDAGGVAPGLRVGRPHRFQHARVGRGGGGVVQVDARHASSVAHRLTRHATWRVR